MKTLRTLLTWGLLSAAAHVMGYSLTVSPIEIEAGQTANLIINLDDAPDNFTAYQMMVYLPDGVTVQKKTNGKYAYTANADRHDGAFTITVKDAADGSVLIACFSADKDVLTGTSGELIRLPLEVASTVTTSLQGSIKNIEFSDVNNNAYNPADVNFAMTLKGGSTPPDVSGDVTVSVPDIEITAGSTADLIVNMQTELTNVTAYQLMVYLPDGVTVQKKANGKYAYTANADRHDGNFTITVKDAADGSVLIACFSADKDVLTGANGELIRLPLEVASTVTTSLQGSIKNIEFSDVNNNAYNPADVNFTMTLKGGSTSQNITFADPAVKALCVANWDTDGDGELSEAEAAAVTDLGEVFTNNKEITSFDELQYFTGLTSIGDLAFKDCSGLTLVTIPENVTSIRINAFTGCSGLTSITIPESVTSIGSGAFGYCSGLTSIIIGSGVTTIYEHAFAYCSKLFSVTIPEKVTYISNYAFMCSGLTSVTIPSSVTSIGYMAFSYCSSLTSVTIPGSVTSIGDDAFCGCSGLTSVTIPNSVTSIGELVFYGCEGLTSITIPNSVTSIGNMSFANCSGLTSITIPESVTAIGGAAFGNCSNLTSISIPESVTSIGASAFHSCIGLASVTIGSGVTSIGVYAFRKCRNLQSIICYAKETPEVSENTFEDVDVSNVTLQVPRESVQKYKDHPVWGKFKIEVIDGIEDVRSGESGEDFERSIYNLSGQKLPAGRMPQGIYIRNGKKIAVK